MANDGSDEWIRLSDGRVGTVVRSGPVPRWRLSALWFDYKLFRAFENDPWTSFWKACHMHFLRRKTLIYPAWKRARLRQEQMREEQMRGPLRGSRGPEKPKAARSR
jgi:hypothetical protein